MLESVTLVVDIDGTLCPVKQPNEEYADLLPHKDMITQLREYRENGARIVLFTSRNMNSYNGSIGLINANTAKVLLHWLDKWDVPYDEIIYGKPWPGLKGFYVDDRAVRPDEFLKYSYEELAAICAKSNEGLK